MIVIYEMFASIEIDDVKKAMFDMAPHKALGLDGIHASIFQNMWDVMCEDLVQFLQHAFLTGSIPLKLNSTLMVMIPKVTHP